MCECEYQVVGLATELPRGSYFITMPELPLRRGTLALFSVGEDPFECLIIGRWYPEIEGYNWIWQPERWIRVARDAIIRIVGRIVPLEFGYLDRLFRSSGFVLPAGLAIIEFWNLIDPLTR